MLSSTPSWPVGPLLPPKTIFRWRSTKLITGSSWDAGGRRDYLSSTRNLGRKSRPVKLQVVRTTCSSTRAEAESTCSPVRASWKFSNRKIPTTMTGLRATLHHPAHKPASLSPNGGNFSRLYKNKVSRTPKSACMRRTKAWTAAYCIIEHKYRLDGLRAVAAEPQHHRIGGSHEESNQDS